MSNNYRILVVTEFAYNSPGGGPAVMRQLLSAVPPENLYWWCCTQEQSTMIDSLKHGNRNVFAIPSILRPGHQIRYLRPMLLDIFWIPLALQHLLKTINNTKPDVILAIPHMWSIPVLAKALPLWKGKWHTLMQDLPTIETNVRTLGNARINRWIDMVCEIYKNAWNRSGTSHGMVEYLNQKTGVGVAPILHMGVNLDRLDSVLSRQVPSKELIIAHAGTIHAEEETALFLKQLVSAAHKGKRRLRVDFYGSQSYHMRPWFDSSFMREHGNLSELDLHQQLIQSHFGLVVMNLNGRNQDYNRFSFPTKLIACLAAGLPIIGIGGTDTTLGILFKDYCIGPWAHCEQDYEKIVGAVIDSADSTHNYRNEIIRCVRECFDINTMHRTLIESLDACVYSK